MSSPGVQAERQEKSLEDKSYKITEDNNLDKIIKDKAKCLSSNFEEIRPNERKTSGVVKKNKKPPYKVSLDDFFKKMLEYRKINNNIGMFGYNTNTTDCTLWYNISTYSKMYKRIVKNITRGKKSDNYFYEGYSRYQKIKLFLDLDYTDEQEKLNCLEINDDIIQCCTDRLINTHKIPKEDIECIMLKSDETPTKKSFHVIFNIYGYAFNSIYQVKTFMSHVKQDLKQDYKCLDMAPYRNNSFFRMPLNRKRSKNQYLNYPDGIKHDDFEFFQKSCITYIDPNVSKFIFEDDTSDEIKTLAKPKIKSQIISETLDKPVLNILKDVCLLIFEKKINIKEFKQDNGVYTFNVKCDGCLFGSDAHTQTNKNIYVSSDNTHSVIVKSRCWSCNTNINLSICRENSLLNFSFDKKKNTNIRLSELNNEIDNINKRLRHKISERPTKTHKTYTTWYQEFQSLTSTNYTNICKNLYDLFENLYLTITEDGIKYQKLQDNIKHPFRDIYDISHLKPYRETRNINKAYLHKSDLVYQKGIWDTIVIKSGTGTSKTTATTQFYEDHKHILNKGILGLVPLQSTCHELSKGFNVPVYLGKTKNEISKSKELIITPESLYKILDSKNKISHKSLVVLDEAKSLITTMTSPTMQKHRQIIISTLKEVIKHADLVVMIGADIDNDAHNFLIGLRDPNRTLFINNHYKRNIEVDDMSQSEIDEISHNDITKIKQRYKFVNKRTLEEKIISLALLKKKTYTATDSRDYGDKLVRKLTEAGIPRNTILFFCKYKTKDDIDGMKDFETYASKFNHVICSPSIKFGVNIATPRGFDYLFGYFTGMSVLPRSAFQMMRRVRKPKFQDIYVCFKSNVRSTNMKMTLTGIHNRLMKNATDINKIILKRVDTEEPTLDELRREHNQNSCVSLVKSCFKDHVLTYDDADTFTDIFGRVLREKLEGKADFLSILMSKISESGNKIYLQMSEFHDFKITKNNMYLNACDVKSTAIQSKIINSEYILSILKSRNISHEMRDKINNTTMTTDRILEVERYDIQVSLNITIPPVELTTGIFNQMPTAIYEDDDGTEFRFNEPTTDFNRIFKKSTRTQLSNITQYAKPYVPEYINTDIKQDTQDLDKIIKYGKYNTLDILLSKIGFTDALFSSNQIIVKGSDFVKLDKKLIKDLPIIYPGLRFRTKVYNFKNVIILCNKIMKSLFNYEIQKIGTTRKQDKITKKRSQMCTYSIKCSPDTPRFISRLKKHTIKAYDEHKINNLLKQLKTGYYKNNVHEKYEYMFLDSILEADYKNINKITMDEIKILCVKMTKLKELIKATSNTEDKHEHIVKYNKEYVKVKFLLKVPDKTTWSDELEKIIKMKILKKERSLCYDTDDDDDDEIEGICTICKFVKLYDNLKDNTCKSCNSYFQKI